MSPTAQQKKEIKASRQALKDAQRRHNTGEMPRESVLAKYEPLPPGRACPISWNGEGFDLEVQPGRIVKIPATSAGLQILARNLVERASAAATGAKPHLGSECYPTQWQIDQWLKVKSASAAEISETRRAASAAGVRDTVEDLGI
jgi:hypothetical protein